MQSEKDQAAAALMESLLDQNLSEVADLPDWVDYVPTGFYHLKCVKKEQKMVETKDDKGTKVETPVVQFSFAIVDTLELEDPTEEKIKPNSQFGETFWMGPTNATKSLEYIKAQFKGLAATVGWQTVGDIVNNLENMEFGAQVKSKEKKDKKGEYFIQLSNAQALS